MKPFIYITLAFTISLLAWLFLKHDYVLFQKTEFDTRSGRYIKTPLTDSEKKVMVAYFSNGDYDYIIRDGDIYLEKSEGNNGDLTGKYSDSIQVFDNQK